MPSERRFARRCGALLVVLLGFGADVSAQTVTDERAWFFLTLQGRGDTTSPWRWSFETILRTRDGVSELDVAAVRPILSYRLDTHSSVGGGFAWVVFSPATLAVQERRVFEQYVWSGALAGGTLTARTRVEQRFIEGNDGMAGRLRQQIRFSHPIRPGSAIAIVGYDEFFAHLNTTAATRRGVDQNRVFAGISDTLSATTRFEAGYLNQFAPGRGARGRMNHVLSGALFFSF